MDYTTIAQGAHLEGLALEWDAIWYSEVLGDGGVHRLSRNGCDTWWPEELWIGGLLLNTDGKLLRSGAGGIQWLDPRNGNTGVLIDTVEGRPLPGVNEMAADPSGAIVFGTVDIPAFESEREPGPASLCRLQPDGRASVLVDGLKFTNGLAYSPDFRQLYHNESYVGTMAYDVNARGGLGNPRLLLEKIDCDGLKVDTRGRIWVTGFNSSEIVILLPDGTIDERFPLPTEAATNLCFGGLDMRDVYITGVDAFAVEDPAQIELVSERKSTLYRMRSAVAGETLARPGFLLG